MMSGLEPPYPGHTHPDALANRIFGGLASGYMSDVNMTPWGGNP